MTYTVKEAIEKGLIILQQKDDLTFWIKDKKGEDVIGFDYLPVSDKTELAINEKGEITAVFL